MRKYRRIHNYRRRFRPVRMGYRRHGRRLGHRRFFRRIGSLLRRR